MRINIVILSYNCKQQIHNCIEHLYNNTLTECNIYIIDNNSQDDTNDTLTKIQQKYQNVHIQFEKQNLGVIKGRNLGFDISNKNTPSDITIFIDADQEVQKNWLQNYIKIFKKNQLDILGSEAWKLNDNYFPICKIKNKNQNFSYVGGCGLCVKNEVFIKLNKFDEDYEKIYFEDTSFCLLANYHNFKIGCDFNQNILHKHVGPLLKPENKKYFIKNLKMFRMKYSKYPIPNLIMK